MSNTVETVRVTDREIDLAKYKKRTALDEDYHQFIDYPCKIYDGDRLIAIYLNLPDSHHELVEDIAKIKYSYNFRTQGLRTTSRIFGYMPRETIRKDYCSAVSLAREDPKTHTEVCEFGKVCTELYKVHAPEIFKVHEDIVNEKVKKDWVIEGTPFTSGIINKNNPLKYHFDAGNFDDVYSNMVAFKKDCKGGHLSIPSYDIGLEIADHSLLFFDGQKILHGVTPFKIVSKEGYRFTIVYYTLKQMWKCQTVNEEIIRIRKRKTEREQRRLQLTKMGGIHNPEVMKMFGKVGENVKRRLDAGEVIPYESAINQEVVEDRTKEKEDDA